MNVGFNHCRCASKRLYQRIIVTCHKRSIKHQSLRNSQNFREISAHLQLYYQFSAQAQKEAPKTHSRPKQKASRNTNTNTNSKYEDKESTKIQDEFDDVEFEQEHEFDSKFEYDYEDSRSMNDMEDEFLNNSSDDETDIEYEQKFDDRGVYYDDQGVGRFADGSLSEPDLRKMSRLERLFELDVGGARRAREIRLERQGKIRRKRKTGEQQQQQQYRQRLKEFEIQSGYDVFRLELYSLGFCALFLGIYTLFHIKGILAYFQSIFGSKDVIGEMNETAETLDAVDSAISSKLMQIVEHNEQIRRQNNEISSLMDETDIDTDAIKDPAKRQKELKKLEILRAWQIQNQKKHELAAAFEILRKERESSTQNPTMVSI